MATTDVKPFNCLPEGVFKVVGPQESVVDAFCFVWDVCNDLVEPPGVCVTAWHVMAFSRMYLHHPLYKFFYKNAKNISLQTFLIEENMKKKPKIYV